MRSFDSVFNKLFDERGGRRSDGLSFSLWVAMGLLGGLPFVIGLALSAGNGSWRQ